MRIAELNINIDIFDLDFILLKPGDSTSIEHMGMAAQAIYKQNYGFIEDLIHTEHEVLIRLNSKFSYIDIERLHTLELDVDEERRTIEWPIYFDGADLLSVCDAVKMEKETLIQKLSGKEYRLAMIGFLPGFIYGRNLDPSLRLPRKAVPSKSVPAGSFAIAESYIGLYSLPSPGGWHCLGRMPCSVLNIPENPPVLMKLTDRIRLKPIDKMEFEYYLSQELNILDYNGLD